jgi:hypothetical protein
VTAFVTAGAGFLLAVLWFDLMFDVQVLRHRGRELPADALVSIAAYYRRVTTEARPMNLLVTAVMLGTLTTIIFQIAGGDEPAWVGWASLGLAGGAIGLAASHTFPSARRLGARRDPADVQSRVARSICRDHLVCVAAIGSLIAIQLGFAT